MNRSASLASSASAGVHAVSPEKADDASADADAQPVGRRAARMDDRDRQDAERTDRQRFAILELDEAEQQVLDLGRRAGVEAAERVHHAQPRPDRPDDGQQLGPRRVEARVHQQERDAAEVIAVQVADDDGVDRGDVHPQMAHHRDRRGAAVDQRLIAVRRHVEGRVQPSAVAEGVTRAEEEDGGAGHDVGGGRPRYALAFGKTRGPCSRPARRSPPS